MDIYCPICNKVINYPVWLDVLYGDEKYVAYCYDCERAYKAHEVKYNVELNDETANRPLPKCD